MPKFKVTAWLSQEYKFLVKADSIYDVKKILVMGHFMTNYENILAEEKIGGSRLHEISFIEQVD